MLVLYVLERFLYRISISAGRDVLILKGGMLLAALDHRRPTRDVDLLALNIDNEAASVAALVRDVLAQPVDDGVAFDESGMATTVIREGSLYPGIRVAVPAAVHRARVPLRIDVNVGDPVTPGPVTISYPALLGLPFLLLGYPVETVLAEKIVTMVERGNTTTRERDFADVLALIRRHDLSAAALRSAITATASHRDAELIPLAQALQGLAPRRHGAWQAFLAHTGPEHGLPEDYADAIAVIAAFADPLLTAAFTTGIWHAQTGQWRA